MDLYIEKSRVSGTFMVPPSKSYTHRYMIAGLLSGKDFKIKYIDSPSKDILCTINAVKSLGYDYYRNNNDLCFVKKEVVKEAIIDAGESGSTLRFFIPIVMALGIKTTFIGTKKLFSRGLDVYIDIFKEYNYHYELTESSLMVNSKLINGIYKIDASQSSQYITGLLFSLPLLKGDSVIELLGKISSQAYLDLTFDVLNKNNIKYNLEDNRIIIYGNQSYLNQDYEVEGDYSNAAFLDIYNYLGGEVKLLGLKEDSLQGDKRYKEYFELLKETTPIIDLTNNLDLGPILFCFASMFNGGKFTGISRLRYKESNRVEELLMELKKLDIEYEIKKDEVSIKPLKKKEFNNLILSSHNDHRIAMSLTAVLSIYGGTLVDSEAVNKSFPNFFEVVSSMGMKVKTIVK